MLVDPAIGMLDRLLRPQQVERHPAAALAAANSVLDRTGYSKTDSVTLNQASTLITIEEAAGMSDEELAVARRFCERWLASADEA